MPVTTQTPRLTNLSYEDLRAWTNLVGGDVDKYIDAINAGGYDVSELQAVEDLASGYMDFYKSADGTYTVTQFRDTFQNVTTNPIDSNVSTTARGNISQMLNRGKDAITGKLNISKFPASGSFASRASYVVGSVGSAIGAVSAGIALGKTIDGALYNVNPDFWDSIGLSSINPETWSSITNGDDSNFAGLFNFILGIDPETGNTQAYMQDSAFAYMAYALAQNGFFNPETSEVSFTPDTLNYPLSNANIDSPVPIFSINGGYSTHAYRSGVFDRITYHEPIDYTLPVYCIMVPNSYTNVYWTVFISEASFKVQYTTSDGASSTSDSRFSAATNTTPAFYYVTTSGADLSFTESGSRYEHLIGGSYSSCMTQSNGNYFTSSTFDQRDLARILFGGGDIESGGSIEGVSNQPNATLPNVSDWDNLDDVLPSLEQQYPDMFQNPLVWDNVQPDGSNPQLRYIPVPMPIANSNTDTQPTTGTQTQNQPIVNPTISPDTLVKLITELSTKTQTDSDPSIPPQNPSDTGTGNAPTPVPPTGSASALWSVYHPTQAQVNSFGAWLWTDNIITQIQQVLQNPMEGIITLHKVFAMPVDSGNGTIVVGRLDSQVPSATVTQQYVTVDCGNVDCLEYFGNVFDYSPHTNISLYLPFIGIVPLNIDDVMRSSIHVIYGVDVFTGACLAMVEVTRDGNTVNMYQYSGVASVEYPLTGSVHGGLITGLLGVAGSVAATVATGGVTAPAAVAAVGGLASAGKSQNARASGFSGNSGAMGIKVPYLIIERPQTKIAQTFPELAGYPTNYSCKLSDCSNHVVVKHVHVEGINATENELNMIHTLLASGVIV